MNKGWSLAHSHGDWKTYLNSTVQQSWFLRKKGTWGNERRIFKIFCGALFVGFVHRFDKSNLITFVSRKTVQCEKRSWTLFRKTDLRKSVQPKKCP